MQAQAMIEKKAVKYSYLTVVLAVLVVGLGFLIYRYAAGLWVTNMGNIVSWGLWISFYILFIGMSAGSFLLSTLIYVFDVKRYERIGRLSLYSAGVCLVIGILFVTADLGHAERFWRVFANAGVTSVLWWEVILYVVYFILLAAEFYLLVRKGDGSKARDMRWVKRLGIIGIPIALGVHGGTGAVFAVIKAVPHWHTPLLPIVFIVSALVSGAALLLMLRAFFIKPEKDELDFLSGLGKLMIGLLAVDWVLVIFEFLVVFYGAVPLATASLQEMLFSNNWWIFWLIQIGVGTIVPTYLVFFARKTRLLFGLAGLAIVIGIVGVRWNILVPGQVIPKVEGIADVLGSARFSVAYLPTAVEILSTAGLVAFFLLLITLGFKYLPLSGAGSDSASEGGQ